MRTRFVRISTIAVLLMAGACDRSSRGPMLTIDTPRLDLGSIPPEGWTVQIPIHNRGNENLTISGMVKSCDCATVQWPKELAVGDSGNITVVIPATIGNRSLRLFVNTNSIGDPREVLLTWHGDGPPTFDPPRVIFRNVVPGTTVSESIRLTYAGGDPRYEPVVRKIQSSSTCISVERGESNPFSKSTSITPENRREIVGATDFKISYAAPEMPGTYFERFTLAVSSPSSGDVNLVLPIEARVVGALSSQGSLVFSGPSLEELLKVRRTIKVYSTAGSESLPAVHAPDFVKCSVQRTSEKSQAGIVYEVTAMLTDVPTESMHRSEIRISNMNCEIAVPLLVLVPEK